MKGVRFLFVLLGLSLLASACGGGGEGDGTIRVNLTVTPRDAFGQATDGRSIKITDQTTGAFFQCSQRGTPTDHPVQCSNTPNPSGAGGPAIIFKDLPTERVYTLTDVTFGVSSTTCQVDIKNSTQLLAQAPCTPTGLNTVEITLS